VSAAAAALRRATFGKFAARLALALFVALFLIGLPEGAGSGPKTADWPGDTALYRAVIQRLRHGEPYETAAVAEMRARRFPLRPFLVVRPPALDVLLSWLPDGMIPAMVELVLALNVVAAWTWRLRGAPPGPWRVGWAALAVFTGVIPGMIGGGYATLFHEEWAGLLIALSLALRTDSRFGAAAALGLLAALIRELALPYLLVMAAFAATERRWREAAAFAAALAAAALALAVHAGAVNALVTSQDSPAVRSWAAFSGWRLVVEANDWNLVAILLGKLARALLFPAALIGALGWGDRRLLTLLIGYAAGFMVFGRLENFYWGLIVAPLVGVGLALAPSAFRNLWVSAGLPARRPATV